MVHEVPENIRLPCTCSPRPSLLCTHSHFALLPVERRLADGVAGRPCVALQLCIEQNSSPGPTWRAHTGRSSRLEKPTLYRPSPHVHKPSPSSLALWRDACPVYISIKTRSIYFCRCWRLLLHVSGGGGRCL